MQKALFGEEVAVSGQRSLGVLRWSFIDWKPGSKIRFLDTRSDIEYFQHKLFSALKLPKHFLTDETQRASSSAFLNADYASIEQRLALYKPAVPKYFWPETRARAKAINFGIHAGFGPLQYSYAQGFSSGTFEKIKEILDR